MTASVPQTLPVDVTLHQAMTHHQAGQLQEAERLYRGVLEVQPDHPEAHNNLGATLLKLGRSEEAENCFRQALSLRTDYAEAHYNLGNTLRDLGRLDEAEASYRRSLEIEPENPRFLVALVMNSLPIAPQTISESNAAPDSFGRALRALSDWLVSSPDHKASFSGEMSLAQPFYLAYRYGNHVELLSRYSDLVSEGKALNTTISNSPDRKKIRLLVISRHFRRHSVWDIILRGLLTHLDRQKFEVVLYHVGHGEDSETVFAKSLADIWRDAGTILGFNGWLDAVGTDQPDIILYPEVGMDAITLRLAALRLAPLQVAGWGHPITTGLPTVDIYLSGELLEPSDASEHYRERLVRLPGTGCCTIPIETIAEPIPRLEALLKSRHGVLFLIAQRSLKFDPADDPLYANIAAKVENSTFILISDPRFPWATDLVSGRLGQVFRQRGLIPEQHLLVIPWLSRRRFYALLDLCDIYLDCPSFSGYTTAWQAIHRGIPVVTLEGKFMRQRLAAGILRKIGLPETIATSTDEYVTIAARLAEECRDTLRRAERRNAIRSSAPQMDYDVSVVRAFENCMIDAVAEKKLVSYRGV